MKNKAGSKSARLREIKTVFLSYHFGEEDETFVQSIRNCIERQGLEVVTGERLGGDVLSAAIEGRIRKADSLIALMTRRYTIGEPEMHLWDTYPFVRDELFLGYKLKKPAIALVENNVEIVGIYSERERINFERKDWDAAIRELEKTLLLWTGKLGVKPIRVQLLPEEIAMEIRQINRLECRYRWRSFNDLEEWTNADIYFVTGGIFFNARRPPDENSLIEVQILANGKIQFESYWEDLEVRVHLHQADE
jgi:hypothetical protein